MRNFQAKVGFNTFCQSVNQQYPVGLAADKYPKGRKRKERASKELDIFL